jgi:cytochrome P450
MHYIREMSDLYRDPKTGGSQSLTIRLPLMPRFIFIASRAENYEHVLKKNFDNYPKGPVFHENFADLLGDGIFNADGHTWQIQRKTASHMFAHSVLRETMHPIFLRHAEDVSRVVARAAEAGAAVDWHDLMHRFTLDSIGEIAFGVHVGSLQNPEIPFARAFDEVQNILMQRFLNPAYRVTEVFTGQRWRLQRSVQVLGDFCSALIRQRRASGDYLVKDDVLSRFMRMKDEDGKFVALDNEALLRDVVLNFIIAGRDTTAQLLSWTLRELTRAPAAERRMVEEILRDVPASASEPSFERVSTHSRHLVYTRAVLHEALRLNPSVPKDAKQAVRDDTLPDGTPIAAGSLVVYLPLLICREKALWGPDADQFRPERWIRDDGTLRVEDPFKYPVFNAGPRTCLGLEMAMQEATSLLAILFRNFSFPPADPSKPLPDWGLALTLPMDRPFLVAPQFRSSKA